MAQVRENGGNGWEPTAELVEALCGDLAQARQALQRAAYIAEHLHVMIDQDTWRATGGDDSQGHYEGDYHAKQLLTEIRGLAALAARETLVERGTSEQTDLGGDETSPVAQEGQTLVTNSALPESHFVREMAIALAASDALAGEDSSTVENAVTWARRLFASAEAAPVHDGDCVNACATCVLCFVQQFVDEARERSGLDEERVFSIGEPPPGTTTDAEQPSPKSSPVSLSVQEGQGEALGASGARRAEEGSA